MANQGRRWAGGYNAANFLWVVLSFAVAETVTRFPSHSATEILLSSYLGITAALIYGIVAMKRATWGAFAIGVSILLSLSAALNLPGIVPRLGYIDPITPFVPWLALVAVVVYVTHQREPAQPAKTERERTSDTIDRAVGARDNPWTKALNYFGKLWLLTVVLIELSKHITVSFVEPLRDSRLATEVIHLRTTISIVFLSLIILTSLLEAWVKRTRLSRPIRFDLEPFGHHQGLMVLVRGCAFIFELGRVRLLYYRDLAVEISLWLGRIIKRTGKLVGEALSKLAFSGRACWEHAEAFTLVMLALAPLNVSPALVATYLKSPRDLTLENGLYVILFALAAAGIAVIGWLQSHHAKLTDAERERKHEVQFFSLGIGLFGVVVAGGICWAVDWEFPGGTPARFPGWVPVVVGASFMFYLGYRFIRGMLFVGQIDATKAKGVPPTKSTAKQSRAEEKSAEPFRPAHTAASSASAPSSNVPPTRSTAKQSRAEDKSAEPLRPVYSAAPAAWAPSSNVPPAQSTAKQSRTKNKSEPPKKSRPKADSAPPSSLDSEEFDDQTSYEKLMADFREDLREYTTSSLLAFAQKSVDQRAQSTSIQAVFYELNKRLEFPKSFLPQIPLEELIELGGVILLLLPWWEETIHGEMNGESVLDEIKDRINTSCVGSIESRMKLLDLSNQIDDIVGARLAEAADAWLEPKTESTVSVK